MRTYLYNCKRCKVGKRIEYPIARQGFSGISHYREENGNLISAGVWVTFCGPGKPTVYGGDPLGVCNICNRAMTYGALKATLRAEVKCNAKCTGSRGFICDCSCSGKNHGAGWSQLGAPLSEVLAA